MLTSLTLSNYRGFRHLEIPNLSRVNLIGGVNNAGKTTILEALYLLLQRDREKIAELPKLFRSPTGINDDTYFWKWLVNTASSELQAVISAAGIPGIPSRVWIDQLKNHKDGTITIFNTNTWRVWSHGLNDDQKKLWPNPEIFAPGPTPPVGDAQVYIRAVKNADNEDRLEALLKEADPRVRRVRAFPDEKDNRPIVFVSFGTGPALPATQLGQGFNRLLRVYSSLLAAEAKVYLIDEIETGLHHSILPTVWKGLAAVARQENVQIFATTHSREAILAAHRVFAEEPEYDFAYHRLERDTEGQIQVITYDKERLEGADERNFEIR